MLFHGQVLQISHSLCAWPVQVSFSHILYICKYQTVYLFIYSYYYSTQQQLCSIQQHQALRPVFNVTSIYLLKIQRSSDFPKFVIGNSNVLCTVLQCTHTVQAPVLPHLLSTTPYLKPQFIQIFSWCVSVACLVSQRTHPEQSPTFTLSCPQ